MEHNIPNVTLQILSKFFRKEPQDLGQIIFDKADPIWRSLDYSDLEIDKLEKHYQEYPNDFTLGK